MDAPGWIVAVSPAALERRPRRQKLRQLLLVGLTIGKVDAAAYFANVASSRSDSRLWPAPS